MPLVLRMLVIVALALFTTEARAATQAQVDSARSAGIGWLLMHQRGDGSWQSAPGTEVQTTALVLDAFMNAGIAYGPFYGSAISWLKAADAPSVDSLSRKISALSGAYALQFFPVGPTSDLGRLILLKNNAYSATWGTYFNYGTSFPDTPLALASIRISGYTYTNQLQDLANSVYCNILSSQGTDGSWSYTQSVTGAPASGSKGAILPTVETIIELNETKKNTGWDSNSCGGPTYSITTAINNGVSWLLTKKNSDGGFSDYGQSTIFETALAYQALAEVNSTNPSMGAALDYLVNHQDLLGSWASDPLQTAMVLKAFNKTTLTDSNSDGIPDSVVPIVGNNPRNLIGSNGLAVSGVTTSSSLAPCTDFQSCSQTLTVSGGTGRIRGLWWRVCCLMG